MDRSAQHGQELRIQSVLRRKGRLRLEKLLGTGLWQAKRRRKVVAVSLVQSSIVESFRPAVSERKR